MSFTTRMINRANYLIKKYGATMTLVRTVAGTYDLATGTTGADTVTQHPCFGVIQFITRTSANQFYGSASLQNTLIAKDDQMCLLNAKDLGIVPTDITDRLITKNAQYNIMFVTPVVSGDTDVLYVLQIRK